MVEDITEEHGQKNTADDGKKEEKNQVAEKEPDQAPFEDKNKLAEEYYDRLLRTQAELENYKKRTEKDIIDFKNYANAQLIKELLFILDDFQTALATEKNGSADSFMKGVELIYQNFYSMLEKEGLNIINNIEETFDPWKHEAVEMVPTDDYPENTVIGVVQPGYKFKDKVLRPAKVKVAVAARRNEDEPMVEDEDQDECNEEETTSND